MMTQQLIMVTDSLNTSSKVFVKVRGVPSYLAGTWPASHTYDTPVWFPQPHLKCNLAIKYHLGGLYLCE